MTKFIKDQKEKILLTVIITLAVFFRVWLFNRVPISLNWDEVSILVDAKAVISTGRDMHGQSMWQTMFPSWGDYKLPVYPLVVIIFSKILGASSFAVRLPNLVASLLQVLVVWRISKNIFSGSEEKKISQTAMASIFVFATSIWSIVFARTGYEAHFGQFLFSLSLMFATSSGLNKTNSLINYLISTTIGVLAVYTYYSVRFVWPIVFILTSAMQIGVRRQAFLVIKEGLVKIIICAAFFFMLLIPLYQSKYYAPSQQFRLSTPSIVNDDKYLYQANVFREVSGNTAIDRLFYNQQSLRLRQFVLHLAENLDPSYLFVTSDHNLRHSTGNHGLFLFVFFPFLLVGISEALRKHLRIFLFTVGWWLASLIPASVSYEVPHALRSINALTPLVLLLGLGVSTCLDWLRAQKNTTKLLVTYAWLGLFCLSLASFGLDYFNSYPIRSATAWNDGYKQLAENVYMQLDKHPEIEKAYVQRTDDRIHLWFMANERYNGSEFRDWQSEKHIFLDLDVVSFSPPRSESLPKKFSQFLLATPSWELTSFELNPNVQVEHLGTIFSAANQEISSIAIIKPKP